MKFVIESGTATDIDELEKLYDDLNDYLSATTNYPGWIKGIYPIRKIVIRNHPTTCCGSSVCCSLAQLHFEAWHPLP